ncbi:hypothetical protein T4D_8103 [Trichinella pseudospiralis]|uniref:Uncharacterized protein n=1 Tax=Trichinella pseudospiralis TaxID=6337 RepID=A0A0V1FY19_TRIPS|nr:hypothetical protein T4D_8103 [Trichinella pseudospiralis]
MLVLLMLAAVLTFLGKFCYLRISISNEAYTNAQQSTPSPLEILYFIEDISKQEIFNDHQQ